MEKKNCDYAVWLAVRFKDDNILYMCPSNSNQIMKIGSYSMIEWKDGYKYKAKLLSKGSVENVKHYLCNIGEKFSIFSKTQNQNVQKKYRKQNKNCREEMETPVDVDLIQEVDPTAFSSEPCKKVVDDKQNMYNITEGQHPIPDCNLVSVNYIINDIDQNKEPDEITATPVEANVDLIQEVDPTAAFLSEPCKKVVVDEQNMYNITEGQHPTPDGNLVYIINDTDQNKEYDEEMATLVDIDLIQEVDDTANFKINKYLDNQTTNMSSNFQFPNLRRKEKRFYREHDKIDNNNSSSSFDEQDSGSEYKPHNDTLSISSSLLHEMDSNESDIEEQPLPTTSNGSVILTPPSISNVKLSVPFISSNFNFDGEVETSKKKNITNKRVWDKVDHCLFCEKNVTNFTRHLLRKHNEEIEVIRFMALPKGSAERKKVIIYHANIA